MAGRLSLLGAGKQTVTAVNAWWLTGGISAANCIIAYQPKGAASLDASYSNLAKPGTYDAALGVAPTWSATDGWIFDGISQTLNIAYTSKNNHSFIIRFSEADNSSNSILCAKGSGDMHIKPRYSTSIYVQYQYSSNPMRTEPGITNGILAIAGTKAYRNGVDEGVTLDNVGSTGQHWIASLAGTSSYKAVKIQALAIYDTVLSAAQISALNTAMGAL